MTVVVWVEGWQIECCGDDFAVGDRVLWTARRSVDDEWSVAAFGPEMAKRITHVEEHHSDNVDQLVRLSGKVQSIRQAWWAYVPVQGEEGVTLRVAGSAVLVEVRDSLIPRGRRPDGVDFNGWIVELDA